MLTDNDITTYTPLGGNIDVDKYRFSILDAQNSRLEELLGETLYNKMLDEFPTYTGVYSDLYTKYIRWFLIHQSALEYILTGAYAIGNSGFYKITPTNGAPIEKTEVDYIANNQRIKADMWADKLQRRLDQNDFPEYKSNYDCDGFGGGSAMNWHF